MERKQISVKTAGFCLVALVGALAITPSCGKTEQASYRSSQGVDNESQADQKTKLDNVSIKTVETPNSHGKLIDQPPESPALLLLDADALEFTYKRVFKEHFPENAFTPRQRQILGTYNIVTRNDNERRSDVLTSLSQEYLKTLREVIATPCKNLVKSEYEALSNEGDPMEHRLVFSLDAPDASQISAAMTQFFGYPPTSGLHDAASDYEQAFKAGIADFFQKNPTKTEEQLRETAQWGQTIQRLYHLLCISIAQDPRVYTR